MLSQEMTWIFEESLKGTADLVIEQLKLVKAKAMAVQVSRIKSY